MDPEYTESVGISDTAYATRGDNHWQLLQALSDPLVFLEENGRTAFLNHSAERLLIKTADELLTRKWQEVISLCPTGETERATALDLQEREQSKSLRE